jgi:hypothetical protein
LGKRYIQKFAMLASGVKVLDPYGSPRSYKLAVSISVEPQVSRHTLAGIWPRSVVLYFSLGSQLTNTRYGIRRIIYVAPAALLLLACAEQEQGSKAKRYGKLPTQFALLKHWSESLPFPSTCVVTTA